MLLLNGIILENPVVGILQIVRFFLSKLLLKDRSDQFASGDPFCLTDGVDRDKDIFRYRNGYFLGMSFFTAWNYGMTNYVVAYYVELVNSRLAGI